MEMNSPPTPEDLGPSAVVIQDFPDRTVLTLPLRSQLRALGFIALFFLGMGVWMRFEGAPWKATLLLSSPSLLFAAACFHVRSRRAVFTLSSDALSVEITSLLGRRSRRTWPRRDLRDLTVEATGARINGIEQFRLDVQTTDGRSTPMARDGDRKGLRQVADAINERLRRLGVPA